MYLSVIQNSKNNKFFTTMSNDGMLRLYQSNEDGQYIEKANIAFGRNLQESMCISELGNDHVVLLVGGYDSKIHVYTIKLSSNKFIYRSSMLGHFNSIKALTVSPKLTNNVLYLASGSQDNNIRIWKIEPLQNIGESTESDWSNQFATKTSYVFQPEGESIYNIKLESVIQHHQESISSLAWYTPKSEGSLQDLVLLSSSFDFTVALWGADLSTEAWSIQSTLGALVGNKHAYFGAVFLNDDNSILAYTYGGALHLWRRPSAE